LTAKHKTNGKYFYQYPGLGNIVGLAIKSDRLLVKMLRFLALRGLNIDGDQHEVCLF